MSEIERYKQCLLRHQIGGGGGVWSAPVYIGRKGQRGFGFGGKFLKFLLPLAKNLGKKVIGKALEVGKDVLIHKKNPKEAVLSRWREIITDYLEQNTKKQSGAGKNKRKRLSLALLDSHNHGSIKRRRRTNHGR